MKNKKSNRFYALLVSIICVAVMQLFAQVVECKFDYCEVHNGHSWGNSIAICFYKVCDDGVPRKSDSKNKPYSCKGSKQLFGKKPNCKTVLAEERQAENAARLRAEYERQMYNEAVAQQMKNQAESERKRKLGEDSVIAKRVANWLLNQIPIYIDKLNSYLVNGNNPTLTNLNFSMDEFDPEKRRFHLSPWEEFKSDPIVIKQPSKGYGIEFHFKENLNKNSCQSGIKAALNITLKKGLQDDVVDGCDFWDNCEKKEGFVIDKAVWNVFGKTYCATELKKFLTQKQLDTRKKLR